MGLLLFSLTLPGTLGEASPVIGEDDEYSKTVEVGESVSFNWTIYRNSSRSYAVNVKLDGFGDWSEKIQPNFFILDDQQKHSIVTLTVQVPSFPEDKEKEGTLTFTFRQLNESTPSYVMEKDVSVEVTGVPGAGEENTIVGGFRNPLPAPLNGPEGAFLLNLFIWFGIGLVSFLVVTPFLHGLTKKTETDLDDIFVKLIRRPLLVLIFLYGFIHSLFKLGIQIQIQAGIYKIYYLLILGVGIYVSYRLFDAVLDEISIKRGGETSTFAAVLKPVLEKISVIVILLGGAIIALRILGIEITPLLAGAGVMGLVIAFAAQDTLSNFFSGMHLLLDRPFIPGDVLLLESGEYCRVKEVGIRSTRLYNIREHEMVILPNNNLANQKIMNLAEPDKKMRVAVEVGVAYGSDIEKVKEILHEVIQDHDDIIDEEGFEPFIGFTEFGDSALNFKLRFWVDDYMKQWAVASTIRERINREFKEAEVTIPFPQRTVWMKDEKDDTSS
ncbi:MAG: mechanosensitive ion channel family protein [Candidatus Thermoplasmatota archaeon]|nr:mechanosensitive ion channel family protein [Candidatus Thermoplasmatota archaeon]